MANENKRETGSSLVTPDNYYGLEEWYIHVIECPKCRIKLPAKKSNYCGCCGIKLKLSMTVADFVENN